MFHDKTQHAAKGKWRGILMQLGMDAKFLVNKHGPCPMCGGGDRFRWDNREGNGTYICNQCGAGDGMALAIAFTGRQFRDVAAQIDGMLGNIKPEAPRKEMTDEDRRAALRRVWGASVPVQPGDLVHRYLASRHVEEMIYPPALRFAPRLPDGNGGIRPAMIAMVGVPGSDRFSSMHRTFLRQDGSGKADDMGSGARKLMPGSLPDGACVALSEYTGGPLGIAEGIETAMAASAMFDLPVWSAINSTMLAKWSPPEGCTEVAIFGDHDKKHGGHAAAWALSHRLRCAGIHTTIHFPDGEGTDWADVWAQRKGIA
jgi:putative DNA primase/helicase